MTVRTRFAPSPTGYLHVGGARTALFAYLYACHHGGQFILRIEDTDLERSSQESVQAILDGMQWLGLDYDEGPFYQTQRFDRYKQAILQLIENGSAYKCYCSKERLASLRETQQTNKQKPRYDGCCRNLTTPQEGAYVIRFKNPEQGAVKFDDQVFGPIKVSNQELDDLIIARTDGSPTYNFTVVIDDWDMNITHVIRGDDHINNTPRQINIFEALGAPVPIYAHVPMILGEDGKRLSKRHGAVSVMSYHDQGYLPQAMLNYLVRLGWSSGDTEIFSLQDMIKAFNLNNVNKSPAIFNTEKLDWLNQHYMKLATAESLMPRVKDYLAGLGAGELIDPPLNKIIGLQVERAKTLEELAQKSLYFYSDDISYDEKAAKKNLKPAAVQPLSASLAALEALSDWQPEAITEAIHSLTERLELKLGKIAQPLRVAITGNSMSPSIGETLYFVGQKKTCQRIRLAIEYIEKKSEENA